MFNVLKKQKKDKQTKAKKIHKVDYIIECRILNFDTLKIQIFDNENWNFERVLVGIEKNEWSHTICWIELNAIFS